MKLKKILYENTLSSLCVGDFNRGLNYLRKCYDEIEHEVEDASSPLYETKVNLRKIIDKLDYMKDTIDKSSR